MSNFVRKFKRFQSDRRSPIVESQNNEKVNEAVREMGDKYSVGGIVVKRSFVNAYVKKVKDQTGQDLKRTMSEQEIAEELVKYTIDTHGDVDSIPVSALVGGEEGMEEEVEDISMEEEPAEVSDDSIEEEPMEEEPMEEEPSEEADELFSDEGDDEFETIEDEESEGGEDEDMENLFAEEGEEGSEEGSEEDQEEESEEDEDLPL